MKQLLSILTLAVITLTAYAQKQPQVQEISVRAPENIKIDGKLNEWVNPLLNAYNSTSRFYYVMSNDDNNLYLTMRGLGTAAANKVLEGGIILTISHSIEKKLRLKAADNVAITFPLPQDEKTTDYILEPIAALRPFMADSAANRKQIDSIVSIANTRVASSLKEIKVIGVKELTDTLMSVYNAEGIKAAARFIKRQPVIEIAIPLKYLGLSINNPAKFSYNIRLNGPSLAPGVNIDDNLGPDALYVATPNDFWGEYILVKK